MLDKFDQTGYDEIVGFLFRKKVLKSGAFLAISLLAFAFLIFPHKAQASIPPEFQVQTGPPFSLFSGWNEILWSSSLVSQIAQTALTDIDSDCGPGTGLVMAKKSGNFWQEYVAEYGGKNFALEADQTYFVKVSRFCDWNPPSVQPTPTPRPTSTPRPTPTPGGGRVYNTLVVKVGLTDGSVSCSESELYDSTFGTTSSINRAYSESSRGAVSLSGSVTTVNLNRSKSELNAHCSVWTDTTIAEWINTAAGIDPVDYDRIMYILPQPSGDPSEDYCKWAGNLHHQNKFLYTTNCRSAKILAHEMGHSVGTYHAATPQKDLGDMSCVMGGGTKPDKSPAPMVQFNAPHRVGLGWVNATTVTSGIYTLVATERDDYVILRTDKDTTNYWYFSYRAPIGEDVDLGSEYVNKVSVHYFSKNPSGGTSSRSYLQATLDVNEWYTEGNMTVEVLSKTAETATIRIDI